LGSFRFAVAEIAKIAAIAKNERRHERAAFVAISAIFEIFAYIGPPFKTTAHLSKRAPLVSA
jgi:hypothetical protein